MQQLPSTEMQWPALVNYDSKPSVLLAQPQCSARQFLQVKTEPVASSSLRAGTSKATKPWDVRRAHPSCCHDGAVLGPPIGCSQCTILPLPPMGSLATEGDSEHGLLSKTKPSLLHWKYPLRQLWE